ncbi:hypothetical protein ACJDU8_01015 [Clostridium sp. WILCCON 0269]|uniref:Uncharacterized protein n=1 Tax=Candidatus Clostridium eludens TaxID=3381663 RepID=A0ABW8SH30_9CLOT
MITKTLINPIVIEQQCVNEERDQIKKFYRWFDKEYNDDFKEVEIKNFENLMYEYSRVFEEKEEYKKSIYNMLLKIILDKLHREKLEVYLTSTKKQHNILSQKDEENTEEQELIFYDDMLGWYEGISPELMDAIDSLYKHQKQERERKYKTDIIVENYEIKLEQGVDYKVDIILRYYTEKDVIDRRD